MKYSFYYSCGLKKDLGLKEQKSVKNLLGAGVFGDSLGSLGDGVLGQFSWKQKTDSSLDLPRRDGVLFVVLSKSLGLHGNALEDIIDKGVHDAHGFGTDSNIGVHLLQDIVDVNSVGFLSLSLPFLVSRSSDLATLLAGTFLALLGDLRGLFSTFCSVRHVCSLICTKY